MDVETPEAGNAQPRGTTKRRVPSCLRCRERHTKCSKERPVCANCTKAGVGTQCTYGKTRAFRFRQSEYSVSVRNRHDDDQRLQESIAISESPEQTSAENASSLGLGAHETLALHSSPIASYTGTIGNSPSWPWSGDSPSQLHNVVSSTTRFSRAPRQRDPAELSWAIDTHSPSSSASARDRRALNEHLSDENECKVFGFYTQHAGHWLDIGSPSRYFQSRVPQLAMREPMVLFACLTCASHIMYLKGEADKSLEDYYSSKVLELLIPLLSSGLATSSNGALLATTVILRMSEQYLEADDDTLHHLNGAASLFADGTQWALTERDMATASFWTHLRESIRVCFLHEQPCPMDLSHLDFARVAPNCRDLSDEAWTNWITYILLEACNACWGDAPTAREATMARLARLIEIWREGLPDSFQPWTIREQEDSPFPSVQCFESWHVVAWQFYLTAKVMLSAYCVDQDAGRSIYAMRRYEKSEIIAPTRWLCGLCISSKTNLGTTLNGSHLMAWCGQFLSGRQEQATLLEFLDNFSRRSKWPNQTSIRRLQRVWGDTERSWTDC